MNISRKSIETLSDDQTVLLNRFRKNRNFNPIQYIKLKAELISSDPQYFSRENTSGKLNDFWYAVLANSLSVIAVSSVTKLETIFGEIGEPDYSVLPKCKT